MKSVLLSIRPQWCELIANGKKTIEVRKGRPKLETPFKVYIYCTKPKKVLRYVFSPEDYEGMFPPEQIPDKKVFCKVPDGSSPFCSEVNGNGKVIGEFVCDHIYDISIHYDSLCEIGNWEVDLLPKTALETDEISKYFGTHNRGYGWHISALQIYDKPRELSEFHKPIMPTGLRYEEDAITRAPQSWCYVEELEEPCKTKN